MSHITNALRMRASGKAAAPSEPDTSALQQYDREERVAAMREVPVTSDRPAAPAIDVHVTAVPHAPSVPPVGRVKPAAPVAPQRAGLRDRAATHVDGHARLVTGTSSAVAIEQYRRLAAALHQAQTEQQLKTVMITSAVPDEGKTLTAVNLALTLSESYERRVLVIDADLRQPSLHDALALANSRGLSEALRDGGPLQFVELSNGLSVLTAGTPDRTPLAGLTSARMVEILEECAARFDWVLIDTPPVGVLPDAQVLGRLVGAVLFVIGAGSTPAAAVERGIAELGGAEAVFGIVLNRVEQRRIPSANYYGHYQAPPKE
jgi:protein-tyrosine kinase